MWDVEEQAYAMPSEGEVIDSWIETNMSYPHSPVGLRVSRWTSMAVSHSMVFSHCMGISCSRFVISHRTVISHGGTWLVSGTR